MKKFILNFIVGIIICGTYSTPSFGQTPQEDAEKVAIKKVLDDYMISINEADTVLGSQIFLTNEKVNFIHPRKHEMGWENIKSGIYGMFGSRFSERDLRSVKETITLFDDVAVLEFYWVFDAVFNDEDATPLQTKGRETQVLKKFGDDWKIIHVHYSSMPVTGDREGF
ncbi:YybH family protein [Sphingobacterium mizutaii]|uniref:YybH family protein n=1 Tax=Sphingobacterium mizutaii TaxID=1010 RepID=UPI00289B539A|nr:nuclear transport factor 2 family protein [Sphingobacterium mizutaii]